ncbi:MAG: alpha/beta hydrolase [Herminiimonas sp.]|nr:alpha/beta hydrolase [Herminiimonas sp.]
MILNVQDRPAYCYTGGKVFDGALPTVMFVHGAQEDHSIWILQTRYFAHHGFGVLAVDLPGHGRSAGPALQSVEQMASWLIEVMAAAGVREALLVGHSMGSLIALESSFQAPARVRRLALLGTAYPMKVSGALLDAALNDEPRAIDMANIWSHSSIAQKPSFPGPGFHVPAGGQRLKQRISQINPDHVFHNDFSACNAYANGDAAAVAVRCPTLFLLAQKDMMTPPRHAKSLTEKIAGSKLTLLQNCGHSMMAEQPDAVLDALFSFATAP